jgi:phosphate uptake regulator
MKRFFDAELEAFRSKLLQMGERAIDHVRLAMRALGPSGPRARRGKVIAADDEIDRLEVQIDEEAIRYMTLRGPVASELRLVIVGMKASHDLERVGDEATSIARRASGSSRSSPSSSSIRGHSAHDRTSRSRCCAMRSIASCTRTSRRRICGRPSRLRGG